MEGAVQNFKKTFFFKFVNVKLLGPGLSFEAAPALIGNIANFFPKKNENIGV